MHTRVSMYVGVACVLLVTSLMTSCQGAGLMGGLLPDLLFPGQDKPSGTASPSECRFQLGSLEPGCYFDTTNCEVVCKSAKTGGANDVTK